MQHRTLPIKHRPVITSLYVLELLVTSIQAVLSLLVAELTNSGYQSVYARLRKVDMLDRWRM